MYPVRLLPDGSLEYLTPQSCSSPVLLPVLLRLHSPCRRKYALLLLMRSYSDDGVRQNSVLPVMLRRSLLFLNGALTRHSLIFSLSLLRYAQLPLVSHLLTDQPSDDPPVLRLSYLLKLRSALLFFQARKHGHHLTH